MAHDNDDYGTEGGVLGDTLIELTDEQGDLHEFVMLEMLEHAGATYVVLIDADDSDEDVSETIIMREVPEDGDDEFASYEVIDDDEYRQVYALFRERNRDLFDFVEGDES